MKNYSPPGKNILEHSDTDPFSVAPLVEQFCEEFDKFNRDAFKNVLETATTFNGREVVDKIQAEFIKFQKGASRHVGAASESIDREAIIAKLQAEYEKFTGQASKMAFTVSDVMSNNACLHPGDPETEQNTEESRDPAESTNERFDIQADDLHAQIIAELGRIRNEATKITLTNEYGQKTYATTSFLDGGFADNPNLWKVDFGPAEPLPLAELEGMEIHVGGNFFVSMSNQSCEGFVEETKAGEVALCIEDRVWVVLSLTSYQPEHLERLKTVDSDKVLDALLSLTSTEINFLVEDIQFFSQSIPGLLSFVTLDGESEQERQEALKTHTFLGEIISVMQANGSENNVKVLVTKGSEILDALLETGNGNFAGRLEQLVPALMAAQAMEVQDLTSIARKLLEEQR